MVTAEDGLEASQAVEEDIYDLVISDIKMPGMNGLDLLRHVKQVSPDTLVVMMTAFSSTEDAVFAMKQGALDISPNPLTMKKLNW